MVKCLVCRVFLAMTFSSTQAKRPRRGGMGRGHGRAGGGHGGHVAQRRGGPGGALPGRAGEGGPETQGSGGEGCGCGGGAAAAERGEADASGSEVLYLNRFKTKMSIHQYTFLPSAPTLGLRLAGHGL